MRKVIVVLALLAIMFMAVIAEGKAKKEKDADTEEVKLYLDDTRLENAATGVTSEAEIAYAKELALNNESLLRDVAGLVLSAGTDFNQLNNLFHSAKDDVSCANEVLLQSLNLRQDVVTAKAAQNAMASGNAGQAMAQKTAEADSILAQMAEEGAILNEKQKVWLGVGMARIGTALAKEAGLALSIKQYVDHVNALPPMGKVKEAKNLPKAAGVIAELPGLIGAQAGTLGKMMKIAKTNNVEVPAGVKLP